MSINLNSGSKEIISVFVQNNVNEIYEQRRMGKSAIYVGTATNQKKCSADFFDTAFVKLDAGCEGDVISIRREGGVPLHSHDFAYNMSEIRAYQVPNLLQELVGKAEVVQAPAPISQDFSVDNLLKNFGTRTSGNDRWPIIDAEGNASSSIRSCYKTASEQILKDQDGVDLLVITIDLKATYFIHAVLLVQDVFSGLRTADHDSRLEFVQNIEIYLGESKAWSSQSKCPNGPYQRYSVDSSYTRI